MASLLITNAFIYTMGHPVWQASVMFVRDGVIEYVGDDASGFTSDDIERIDAGGKAIVPGFHDCHLHLLWYGKTLVAQANLVGATSVSDVLDRLRDHARQSRGWIVGHGFDQSKLAENRFPTRAELDAVSPDRPILITRVCAHAAVVNSAALAHVTPAERAAGDEASGLYTEEAIGAFHRRVPPMDDETADRALRAACDVSLKTGITSMQTLIDDMGQWPTYVRALRRDGRLPVRVVGIPPQADVESLADRDDVDGLDEMWLKLSGAKFFSDGSLGARTALLAAPYADDRSVTGLRIYPGDSLKRRCVEVAAMGRQLVIHAIGDQALRESIDAIEAALAGADNRGPRHRIEHASVCPPDLLDRMVDLKIVATLQPQFVTSDTWTGDRLGPTRRAWAYPFASMLKARLDVGLSSDAPVETLDAFACLAAAIGRHDWSPSETIRPIDAVRAYTVGSAYCGHREHLVGTLEPGRLADFVILSESPWGLSAERIRTLRAERVFVGGVEARRA